MFTAFFLLRRFIHAYATVFAKDLYVDLYVNFFSSLYLLRFYLEQKPLQDRLSNRVEILNELFVFTSNYFIIVLPNFLPDIEVILMNHSTLLQ